MDIGGFDRSKDKAINVGVYAVKYHIHSVTSSMLFLGLIGGVSPV